MQADAAPGKRADRLDRAEAALENQRNRFAVFQRVGVLRRNQGQLDGLLFHALGVNAAPIVLNFDNDLIALVARRHGNDSLTRFPCLFALFRRFDAVINRVADEMNQRLAQHIHDGFVQFRFRAENPHVHVFSGVAGEIAHHARKTVHDLRDRHHADAHRAFLHLAGESA